MPPLLFNVIYVSFLVFCILLMSFFKYLWIFVLCSGYTFLFNSVGVYLYFLCQGLCQNSSSLSFPFFGIPSMCLYLYMSSSPVRWDAIYCVCVVVTFCVTVVFQFLIQNFSAYLSYRFMDEVSSQFLCCCFVLVFGILYCFAVSSLFSRNCVLLILFLIFYVLIEYCQCTIAICAPYSHPFDLFRLFR